MKPEIVQKRRNGGFTLLELTVAMGVMMIATAGFCTASRSLDNFFKQRLVRAEAAAVLDNTLERVTAMPQPVLAAVRTVFDDEFAKSDIREKDGLRRVCEVRNRRLCLAIHGVTGRELARLDFPLAEAAGGSQP